MEYVRDYPRPPRLEAVNQRLRVEFGGQIIAETERGFRILETYHPPTYYIPPGDVRGEFLVHCPGSSFCEFKGLARYYSIVVGDRRSEKCAWSYPSPNEEYVMLRDCIAFYASRVDSCYVDNERVQAQAGDFYGGWITSDIHGPFKGEQGTLHW